MRTSSTAVENTEQQIKLPFLSALSVSIGSSIGKSVLKVFDNETTAQSGMVFDRGFVVLALVMYMIGLVMVASSSMPVAERLFNNPFHFVIRHTIYIVLSLGIAGVALQIPMAWWQKNSSYLLMFGILYLTLTIEYPELITSSSIFSSALIIIPLTYLLFSIRYWFIVPTIGFGISVLGYGLGLVLLSI